MRAERNTVMAIAYRASLAGEPDGMSVVELAAATGLSRRGVYDGLAAAGVEHEGVSVLDWQVTPEQALDPDAPF